MNYKLLTRNKTYPHDWETCVWKSETIENLTEDQCSWWLKFLVHDNGIHPKILRVVSNDFDVSTLNPSYDGNEIHHIERGIME